MFLTDWIWLNNKWTFLLQGQWKNSNLTTISSLFHRTCHLPCLSSSPVFPDLLGAVPAALHVSVIVFCVTVILFSSVATGFFFFNAFGRPYETLQGPMGLYLWSFICCKGQLITSIYNSLSIFISCYQNLTILVPIPQVLVAFWWWSCLLLRWNCTVSPSESPTLTRSPTRSRHTVNVTTAVFGSFSWSSYSMDSTFSWSVWREYSSPSGRTRSLS